MPEGIANRWSLPAFPRRGRAFLGLVVAALIGGLAACGQTGPQQEAARLVERYLSAKQDNDYEAWQATLWVAQQETQPFTPAFEKPGDLGVLSLSIGKVAVSNAETRRIQERYSGSELARAYGWSDDYIAQNMLAVSAEYTIDYDNTKVPYPEGTLTQYFYLVRDDPDSTWLIWETSSPNE
jgi:hypothetical protein